MTALPPIPPPLPQVQAPAPAQSPLSEAHWEAIRQAQLPRRALLKAASTAKFSSVTLLVMAVLGILSLPFGVTVENLVIVAGLAVTGMIELRGSRRFRQASPSVARDLGLNQLALGTLIILYCIVQMVTFRADASSVVSPEVAELLPQMPEMQRSVQQMTSLLPMMMYGFYGLVILLSVLMQGGLALYYFTRRKHVEAFRASTPEWLLRLYTETGI